MIYLLSIKFFKNLFLMIPLYSKKAKSHISFIAHDSQRYWLPALRRATEHTTLFIHKSVVRANTVLEVDIKHKFKFHFCLRESQPTGTGHDEGPRARHRK